MASLVDCGAAGLSLYRRSLPPLVTAVAAAAACWSGRRGLRRCGAWLQSLLAEPAFHGRENPTEKIAVISYPGKDKAGWRRLTRRLRWAAVACVYGPPGQKSFYGRHLSPCRCGLYRGKDPKFSSWPGGQAPHGCEWFGEWLKNLDIVKKNRQVGIIVYMQDLVDRDSGLGNSQRIEVEEAERTLAHLVKCDIREFWNVIVPAARDRSLAAPEPAEVKRLLEDLLTDYRKEVAAPG